MPHEPTRESLCYSWQVDSFLGDSAAPRNVSQKTDAAAAAGATASAAELAPPYVGEVYLIIRRGRLMTAGTISDRYDEGQLLGDLTYWGPRLRLRCINESSPHNDPTSVASRMTRAQNGRMRRWGDEHGMNDRPKHSLIPPGRALQCMEKVRTSLGVDSAKLFVAVDAPRLQEVRAARCEG